MLKRRKMKRKRKVKRVMKKSKEKKRTKKAHREEICRSNGLPPHHKHDNHDVLSFHSPRFYVSGNNIAFHVGLNNSSSNSSNSNKHRLMKMNVICNKCCRHGLPVVLRLVHI